MANALYFADLETTTSKVSTDSSRVWIWGVKGSLPGDKMIWDLSLDSFFETLKNKKMKEIYFHNLSFDGEFLFKYMLKNYDSQFIRSTIEDNYELKPNEWTWICDDTKNIYCIEFNYKGHTMTFYDSWKVLMSSVRELGETLGENKLEIDYDKFNVYDRKEDVPAKALEYLERDIDIVIKSFSKVIEIYKKRMTRASMAYEDFQNFYGKSNFAKDFGGPCKNFLTGEYKYKNVLTWKDWELGHSTYQGGYVNWNKEIEGKTVENISGISYDVNSLYPSVMMNYKMPYGRLLHHKPLNSSYETIISVFIKSAKKKNPKAPSLIKDRSKGANTLEDKYLDHVENEVRSFWVSEWDFICEHYDTEFQIISLRYIKTKYVFKEWLENLNHLKINATSKTEENFHKGIFNSLYGKFAQHWNVVERIIIRDEEMKYPNRERYGKNGEYTYHVTSSDKPNDETRFKHIFVGSYITHKARMTLWESIFANLDIWLYSDTDSCYYSSEDVKGFEIHETKFGAWKGEHKFNKFKVLRAKCYMFNATAKFDKKTHDWVNDEKVVRKIAGLGPEGKEKINFDNFKRGIIIEDGKKASKSVEGGKLIMSVPYTIGEL